MKHFETRQKANAFLKLSPNHLGLKIFKKRKGMKNRIKKPFLIGTEFQWLNQE